MDLIKSVMSYVTPDVVSRVAGLFGEPGTNTQRAIEAGVPTVLAGLAQTGSTETGAARILGALEGEDGTNVLGRLGTLSDGEAGDMTRSGEGFLRKILGDRFGGVAQTIASVSGIGAASATGILGLVASFVSSFLGREVKAKGLDARSFSSLMRGALPTILASGALPAGVASLFGSIRPTAQRVSPAGAPLWRKWIVPAVLAALALVCILMIRGRRPSTTEEIGRAMPTVSLPPAAAVTPPVTEELKTTAAELPQALRRLDPSGLAGQMAAALMGGPKGEFPKRLAGDDILFVFASSDSAQPDRARASLADVAEVLKAYPNAQVRLEGHTDSVGAADTNKRLGEARATRVKDELVARGVDAGRIEVVSLAETEPVAPNDVEEGRARNRRVDFVILAP
jgi:OmpA-OmpF porin, OOP family